MPAAAAMAAARCQPVTPPIRMKSGITLHRLADESLRLLLEFIFALAISSRVSKEHAR
jgi:hypothetical protein